ncbi:hypothetical protein [Agrobacterium tumefaciens]|uniref:hypothetical protein n=1 Tax=Agrobacterium tumefaciens TaxID=358 RepID=UPI001572CEEE|nr:hypothetical protein [Agrobacterium tumefaciens]
MVPVEPTEEMREAIFGLLSAYDDGSDISPSFFMKMLINAAPQPPALGGEPEVLAIFKADGSALYQTKAGFERQLTGADIELVDRAHVARLQAELSLFKDGDLKTEALREQEAEIVRLRPVRLPERKLVTVGLLSESNTHNKGWNACLDAAAQLNAKPAVAIEPTIEMMEQGSVASNYDVSQAMAGTIYRAMENMRLVRLSEGKSDD